jgi:hypothetical protein
MSEWDEICLLCFYDNVAALSTIIPLEIWDCPGHVSHETLGVPLSQFSTLLFIIDIQVCKLEFNLGS